MAKNSILPSPNNIKLVICILAFFLMGSGCGSSIKSSNSSSSSTSNLIGTWAECMEGGDDGSDTKNTFEFENDGDYFLTIQTYSTTDGTCSGEYEQKDFLSYEYSTNSSDTAFTINNVTDWQMELSDSGITNNSDLCGLSDWQAGYAKNSVALNASFSSTEKRYFFAIPSLPDDIDTEQELLDSAEFNSMGGPLISYINLSGDFYYCYAYQDVNHEEEFAFSISDDVLSITFPDSTLNLSKE